MLVGALLLAIGVLCGWVLADAPGEDDEPTPRPTPRPAAMLPECGCGHSLAFHNPTAGTCRAPASAPPESGSLYALQAALAARKLCLCQQYVGPVPLAEYYAPEVTP